jgi:eukaryotic-like serine/threonine-protein kinase
VSDGQKGDILIVDDNPVNLNVLSGMLGEQDFRVRVATGGRRALMAARTCAPDLIMLDINMPDMDGYEVCRQLKADEATRDVPVIFISALDETMDKVRAFESGGADYVTKPFQFGEVLARIENQLKISRLQKVLERKNDELNRKNDELVRKNDELVRSREEILRQTQRVERMFSALSEVLPGTLLDDKYRLEEKIGSGGFGAVFRATHLGLDRSVAVKIFRPRTGDVTPEALERFRREGVSACRVIHANAVQVLDSGISSAGIAYLVMELLEGRTLGDMLKDAGPVQPDRTVQILLPVCEVLAEAHNCGVIHRDVKPDNIFLHATKEGEVVKVLDFGLAKLLGDETSVDMQNMTVGQMMGTPTYMPPERLNDLPYDGRADVYSLGVMMYQMLSGRVPFFSKEGDTWAVAVMHLTKEPAPLREGNPDIPASLEAIVMRTLAKLPAERPTARELVHELSAVLANSA